MYPACKAHASIILSSVARLAVTYFSKFFIHLPMKMEPIVSSETSAIRNQTPGNYPKRNNLHLEHGESLRTRFFKIISQTARISNKKFIEIKTYVLIFSTFLIETFLNIRKSEPDLITNLHTYIFMSSTRCSCQI